MLNSLNVRDDQVGHMYITQTRVQCYSEACNAKVEVHKANLNQIRIHMMMVCKDGYCTVLVRQQTHPRTCVLPGTQHYKKYDMMHSAGSLLMMHTCTHKQHTRCTSTHPH